MFTSVYQRGCELFYQPAAILGSSHALCTSNNTYASRAKFERSFALGMIALILALEMNTLDLTYNDIKASVCSENENELFKELKESMKTMNQPNENFIK